MRIQMRAVSASLLLIIFSLFAPSTSAALVEDISINSYELALIPYNHGRVVSTSNYRKGRYPSLKQNMQFMLFYNANSTTGYYVQTEDSAGHLTDWEIRSVNGVKTLRLTFHATSKPNIVKQTITIAPDKPYLAAAEKYKTWAFQQSWAKRKPSKLDSVKYIALGSSPYFDWLRNTELPPLLSEFEDINTDIDNPATATWLTLWRADAFDVNYPRYTPATIGGAFTTLLSSLHGLGSIPMPYINGCLWDDRMNDPDGVPGHQYNEDHMIKNDNGQLSYYNTGSHLAYACPSSPAWQEIIGQARNDRILDSSGTKSAGVYYDVIASAEPMLCSNPAHTHGNNNSLIWQESFHGLLANTDGVVMIEGSAETYIDVVDVFLMHLSTNSVDRVPLWNAVYGTITRTAGWYINAASQTPATTLAALKEAKSFGSRTWGSPFMASSGNALDYQRNLLAPGYEDVLNMVSASPVVIEDGSNGINNWWNSGNIVNTYDSLYGKDVIEKTGTGVAHTAYPEWNHTGTNARWSLKRTNPNDMITGFKVTTTSNKVVYLYYTDWAVSTDPTISGSNPYYIYHGIGIAPANNGWQTIDRNLESDLRNKMPNETISQVKQFIMFNNPGSVADIKIFPRFP